MSQQGADAVAAAIAAVGDPQAMAGEGADRRYVVDGQAWRVRVRMIDQRPPSAPVNGAPVLAPVSFGVGVSVALLDDADAVAKDGEGGLLVFDQHPVGFDSEGLGNPDFDPVIALNHAIAREIAAAAAVIANKKRLAVALAPWAPPEKPDHEEE